MTTIMTHLATMVNNHMLSRRKLLTTGLYLTGFAALTPLMSWSATPSESSDTLLFHKLSILLTGREQISPLLASRALNCLTEEDSQFPVKQRALYQALSAANITHADQLMGSAIMSSPDTGATAKKIISAWYLGYTGTPVPLRAVDNTRFVTFTDALMYTPTLDATVIPTYSRGHTNYWVEPPSTIKND